MSFLVMFEGIIDYNVVNIVTISSDFSSKFQSSMAIFHHKLLTTKGRFGAMDDVWMISCIIHNNICSLIHKKCHPKS